MDQDRAAIPNSAAAGEAFVALQAEVSLLRRGVEALTVERQAAPDYAPSFARLEQQYQVIRQWAKGLAQTPALKLDPARIGEEIDKAATAVRTTDRETIEAAGRRIDAAVETISRTYASAVEAEEQLRHLCLTGGICVLAGMSVALGLVDIDRTVVAKPTVTHVEPAAAPATRTGRARV